MSPTVLLVEDSRADAMLLEREFRGHSAGPLLKVATDADQALAILRDASMPKPGLIILDLKLPKRDGRELLREIKEDPAFRRIPVVVLTSSTQPGDVDRCYELRANAYVAKPVGLAAVRKTVRSLCEFWLETAHLPER